MSSLHYDPTWHGEVVHSNSAQRQTSQTSADERRSGPVIFDNVIHSPTAASQQQSGQRRGLFARLFSKELKRAFGIAAQAPQISVLDFVHRRKT